MAILGVLAVVVFCALFFRLWALQVISGERYLEEANNNQIRSFGVIAPRGSIVDRDGDVLVSNKAGTLVQIWPAALEKRPARRARADAAAPVEAARPQGAAVQEKVRRAWRATRSPRSRSTRRSTSSRPPT